MSVACQNCKNDFTIEPDDLEFYKKISVPSPTWCPECRLIRRMAFANERTLYKRTCDLCSKGIISMYPDDSPFPVYCIGCWRGDAWDPLSYGTAYDSSRSFFEQFHALKQQVPRMALVQQGEMVASEYTNRASNNKHCYLIFRANYNENSLYSHTLNNSKDCVDCFNVQQSELSYECIDCTRSYNLRYSQECRDCRDSMFLYDCRNCSDCIGCVNLRNKQYHIWNKPYTKEGYEQKREELKTTEYEGIRAIALEFEKFSKRFIREFRVSLKSEQISGNWIYESKNAKRAFGCHRLEDCSDCFGIIEAKDCRDFYYWGRSCELIYETANAGYNSSRLFFCNTSHTSCSDLRYCDSCVSSRNCFGSVGLKNQEYVIFNRKYSPDEYQKVTTQIIEQMKHTPYVDDSGRTYAYGEFFPVHHSEFAYNETAAQDYFPLTKREAVDKGFLWKDREEKSYEITLAPDSIPGNIEDIDDNILKEIIGCEHRGTCNHDCVTAFRITPQELQFYRTMNLPLPKLCFNCRHAGRLGKRNPPKLWTRTCQCAGATSENGVYANTTSHSHGNQHCSNIFKTSYKQNREEIVYCKECYEEEVV